MGTEKDGTQKREEFNKEESRNFDEKFEFG